MKELLKNGQKISMVPENIKGALSSTIKKVIGNSIEIEVSKADSEFYAPEQTVEMFTVVDDGMLYFKPVVSEIREEEGIIKVNFDKEKYDLLQRREYTRIELDKEFTLKDEDKDYVCKCEDISAGGMKFITSANLSVDKDYTIEFALESNIPIQCFFKPIRTDKQKDGKNIVSGRFIALKNIDKIAIVQFCFKKQMENTNK
ncbi:MAG: PilZ domain-containing protein [Clostridium sp.]|nr:PilZ domain-containing protein [Clostridium sp.]